jgi:hypothetical protein
MDTPTDTPPSTLVDTPKATIPEAAGGRNSRLQAWLLAALFLAPLLASFVLYYGGDWRPHGHTNHGDLVQPLRALPAVSLPTAAGGQTSPRLFIGKWTLIYIGAGDCNERCRTALIDTRQVRLALGRDLDRVQRVFLYTGECCRGAYDRSRLDREQSDLVSASFEGPTAGQLHSAFPSVGGVPAAHGGRIYIADPLGNLVLSYAADAPRKGLLEDLKKLLKLSHIG